MKNLVPSPMHTPLFRKWLRYVFSLHLTPYAKYLTALEITFVIKFIYTASHNKVFLIYLILKSINIKPQSTYV